MREEDHSEGTVTIGPPSAPGTPHRPGPVPPVLTFARVPEGKTVKNRLHIDLTPAGAGQGEEVRRLLALGARPADVGQAGDESWVTLADPNTPDFQFYGSALVSA